MNIFITTCFQLYIDLIILSYFWLFINENAKANVNVNRQEVIKTDRKLV